MYRKRIKKIAINIAFYISLTISIIAFIRVFIFSSFSVPTNSMQPVIIPGDKILVNKLVYGARIFDVFAALSHKHVDIYRMPAFGKIKRNDIIVFNFPYPKTWSRIEMDMLKYYVKRCIGLPGDSIEIKDCFYFANNNTKDTLGNIAAQLTLQQIPDSTLRKQGLFYTFPNDSVLNWNMKNFGNFYIPKKGDTIDLNVKHSNLYYKLIAWEMKKELKLRNDTIWQDTLPVLHHTFTHNYYFVAGDNVVNSQDSRYWALLPDEYIVGKAWIIWKSVDPLTNKLRTDRILKTINNQQL